VDQFAFKMEELKQFDKKIRIMANLESRRDREQLLGIGGPVNEEKRLRSQMERDDKSMIADAGKQVDRLMEEASSREQELYRPPGFPQGAQISPGGHSFRVARHGLGDFEFGRRTNPFGNDSEFHKGLDIATGYGRPIQAPADGIVSEVSYQQDVGQMIQIDHGHGVSTFYGHLSKAVVRPVPR